ncbi:MAG: ABC transporter ATP-binding protein, partial [Halioglobus sp.]|nr:ABC transporter ATP-binding protein [Halioglobus sp.]
EPTNHLDLDMRHAMEVALQDYAGALVLVSHDRHMLRNTVEELLLVHDGRVEEYRDDLRAYETWILSRYSQEQRPESAAGSDNRRQQRKQSAAHREQRRPLQKKLEQIERDMSRVAAELAAIQEQLADTQIYDDTHREALASLLQREGQLQARAEALDESWLEQQQALEELGE